VISFWRVLILKRFIFRVLITFYKSPEETCKKAGRGWRVRL